MSKPQGTFAQRIAVFNRGLRLDAALPPGIAVMNPFAEEDNIALQCADAFYEKYYSDNHLRRPILGINPGRHGAALSGVPFTDFKRLRDACGIDAQGRTAHEPSSEFIYAMISALDGPEVFYAQFYINSVCPLGFVQQRGGRWLNYNYYDDPALYAAVKPFIIKSIRQQIALGLNTDECFCLGKKNSDYLRALNAEHCFFGCITELPHPRFVIQYKRKLMDQYIAEYAEKLRC